jgi:hypothetical protein
VRQPTLISFFPPLPLQERVKDALMILPDKAAKEIEPQWFEEGEYIRVADAFVVDIMLNANGQTYDTLRQYSQTLNLDGIPVRTVNLEEASDC